MALRFLPEAWMKLLWFRDKGDTEVSGYGVSDLHDPLLVRDVYFPKQQGDSARTKMDDDDLADRQEQLLGTGLEPWQYGRIWVHTHPGNSPTPSGVDEDTFSEIFRDAGWAVMVVVAKGGATYARLAVQQGGMRMEKEIPVRQAWVPSQEMVEAWEAEYQVTPYREQIGFGYGHGFELEEPNSELDFYDQAELEEWLHEKLQADDKYWHNSNHMIAADFRKDTGILTVDASHIWEAYRAVQKPTWKSDLDRRLEEAWARSDRMIR